jgi:hypothetical protein
VTVDLDERDVAAVGALSGELGAHVPSGIQIHDHRMARGRLITRLHETDDIYSEAE